MLSEFKMSGFKLHLVFVFCFVSGLFISSISSAQSVFYLESTDNFNGEALKVEYRVTSVKSGKSYTIKNVEGLLFFELPEPEDVKIKITREGYYVEEKTIDADDLRDGETLKFQLSKRPTAKLVLSATDGETGKPEPASFDIFLEGRMIGRGTTSRAQASYELLAEQDGNYQVVVHAKSYDDSKADIPIQVSTPQNKVNHVIPLFKPAKEIGIRLVDEQKGNPVKADVEIKLTETGEVLYTGSPENGLVLFTFKSGKNYTITAGSAKYNKLEKKIGGSQREDLILRLRPNTYVEFRIISKATGKPIPAEVLVRTPSGLPVLLEEMSFVPGERGAYRVEVSSPGYVSKSGSFTVNTFTGGAMEVLYDLDLADQQYHVKVIDHFSKEVLRNLEFRVFGPKGQQLQGIKSDEKGEYVFVTDPAKEYFIEVSKEDYTDLTKMLKENEKTLTVELWWAPEVTYNLRVIEQQVNKPVFNAKVKVKNSKGESMFVYDTGSEGLFKVKLPRNETYSYVVDAPGFEPGIVGVNTKSGNNIELLVARANQQSLAITITDFLTGKPIDAGATLTLSSSKVNLKKVSQGIYRTEYSPSNAYVLEVIASGYKAFKEEVRSSLVQGDAYPVKLKKENYLVRFKIENIPANQGLREVDLKVFSTTGSRVAERFLAKEAVFEANLQPDLAYRVEASKEGFQNYSSEFTLQDLVNENLTKTFRMIPLPEKPKQEPEEVKSVLSETIKPAEVAKPAPQTKIFEKPAETLPVSSEAMASEFNKRESLGKRYLLDEVYFDQSSASIRDEEVQQLNELAATLKSNQNLVVEIVGYTDNVGDPRLNVGLSQFRAKAVANYLFNKGANPNHIRSRGLGQDKPVAENDSEENRAKNRRVELVLIEN